MLYASIHSHKNWDKYPSTKTNFHIGSKLLFTSVGRPMEHMWCVVNLRLFTLHPNLCDMYYLCIFPYVKTVTHPSFHRNMILWCWNPHSYYTLLDQDRISCRHNSQTWQFIHDMIHKVSLFTTFRDTIIHPVYGNLKDMVMFRVAQVGCAFNKCSEQVLLRQPHNLGSTVVH
jgi:hypothetical protein